jgi:Plant protein of unknown function (DUF639)
MVTACADLLGRSMEQLSAEFDAIQSAAQSAAAAEAAVGVIPNSAKSSAAASDPLLPRDLADHAIMATLKSRDTFAMQNAPSWLFNTMDRSGAGFVLRDEFIRYSPLMSPIADSAVAASVFDELLRAQVSHHTALAAEAAKAAEREAASKSKQRRRPIVLERVASLHPGVRARNALANDNQAESSDAGHVDSVESDKDELYPISVALRYSTWKQYFDAIQAKYECKDDEWDRVRRELGLDPSERLVKSQGAVDHSDLWPTLGKLYLTQRYLVFFAAVGRNHYVARLGSVASVGVKSLPLLMRDCFTVKLGTETEAAMNGVSAPVASKVARSLPSSGGGTSSGKGSEESAESDLRGTDGGKLRKRPQAQSRNKSDRDEGIDGQANGRGDLSDKNDNRRGSSSVVGSKGDRDGGSKGGWGNGKETPLPQHVVSVMKQFTAGGKPLVFSLIEFRETTRRDHWMCIIKEMVASHRLHVKLGFGSSGRVARSAYPSPSIEQSARSVRDNAEGNCHGDMHVGGAGDGLQVDPERRESSCDGLEPSGECLVYLMSPFRNEPPPPLLAVAAHANVVRYRSLKVTSGARNPVSVLVFSRADMCPAAVNWYVDSVRAHDNRAGQSWIERAMDAIRENMEINKRVYVADDDEPFDVARLGEGIGRLAELCTPVVRLSQFITHILQWRNPPATVLALVTCCYFVYSDWVRYIPTLVLLFQAGLIVATRNRVLGLDGWMWGGGRPEEARQRQANVLELVSSVHDTLCAAQNVIKRLNNVFGKLQTLCLWGTGAEWQSWVAVAFVAGLGVLVLVTNVRTLFVIVVLVTFSRHFAPPHNPPRVFWAAVPSRVVVSDAAGAKPL